MAASKPTPAGTSGAASLDTQQGAQVSGQGQAPKPEAKQSGKPDLIVKVGIGPGFRGDNDGDPFATGRFGDGWNHTHTQFKLAPVWQLNNSKKFRVKLGPEIAYQNIKGNERSPGSIHMGELGVVLDLQNTDAFLGINGGKVQFLPFFDLGVHFALAGGDTPLNSIRIWPTFGPGITTDLSVGILGVSIPKVMQVNLAVQPGMYWYHNTKDAGENVGGWSIMPQLVFRGPVDQEEKPDCKAIPKVKQAIQNANNEIKELLAQVEDYDNRVLMLRAYLENHPKHPFVGDNLDKARVLGFVEEQLQLKMGCKLEQQPPVEGQRVKTKASCDGLTKENIQKIASAIKAASKAPKDKVTEVIAKETGVAKSEVDTMYAKGKEKLAGDPNFWALPSDSSPVATDPFDKVTNRHKNKEVCETHEGRDRADDDLMALLAEKEKLSNLLTALTGQYRRAIHLAGLTLGQDIDPFAGVEFLQVDTPNFDVGRPTDGDIAKIKAWAEKHKGSPAEANDAELLTILNARGNARGRRVFNLPTFETKKLKDFANWMLGKGPLPGSERYQKMKGDIGEASTEPTEMDKQIEEQFRKAAAKQIIKVVGHTDSQGGKEMNKALSLRRADAVKYILVGMGVSEARIETYGLGPDHPTIPEEGLQGEQRRGAQYKNRRLEFIPKKRKPEETAPTASEYGDAHVPEGDLKKDKGEGKGKDTKPETKLPETKPGETKKPSPWDARPTK